MRDIKAGDVVTLKTGGPEMAVSYSEAGCLWFCHDALNYKIVERDPPVLAAKKSSIGDIVIPLSVEVKIEVKA